MRIFTAVTLGCLLLIPACGPSPDADIGRADDGALRPGTIEVTDSLTRIVSPADRRLVFDGFRGRFRLQGQDGETANLTLTKRGRGTDSTEARTVLNDIQVTETGTADTYTFEIESAEPPRSAVDVVGTVPHSVSLRVDQESGQFDLRGARGPIVVQQRFGDVRIRDAAAEVEVSVETGDLIVEMDAVPADAQITLRTANGDVHFALPPQASVQVDARTRAGEVRVQGLTFEQERLTPVDAGARYTAQLGGGDAVVELRTENGIVTLAAGDPPPDTMQTPPALADSLATPPDTIARDTTAPDTTAPAPSDTAAVDTSALGAPRP